MTVFWLLLFCLYRGAVQDSVVALDTGLSEKNKEHLFPSLSVSPTGTNVNKIYKIRVEHFGKDTPSEVAENREPLVLLNSPAGSWPALNWNFSNLSSSWNLYDVLSQPVTTQCKESLFYIHDSTPDSGDIRHSAAGSSAVAPKVVKEMTLRAFLAGSRSDTAAGASDAAGNSHSAKSGAHPKARRLLYSTDYRELESELRLQNDTNWREFLVDDLDCGNATAVGAHCDESAIPVPVLTMLYPGSALQARYSAYHTMRVQVKGSAVYSVFAPHAAAALHLYPSVHRCAGQAQINLYEEGGGEGTSPCGNSGSGGDGKKPSPLFAGSSVGSDAPPTTVYKTTLRPGEVLYIPPYWLVHSEALTLSASLDVHSVSSEQLLLLPLNHMQLPFQTKHASTKSERVVSAQVFIVHVLSRIRGFKSVLKYAQSLYQTRYSALYPEEGLFLQRSEFSCLRDDPTLYNKIVNKLQPEILESAAAYVAARLNNPLLRSTLVDVGSTEAPVPAPQRGVRWIWLADYIEQVARWAMGDSEEVVLFIRECLNMDTVLQIIEEVAGPTAMKMTGDSDDEL